MWVRFLLLRKRKKIYILYLCLGSQFVNTVRSLLSLKVSQGTSSSSEDKDMALTLSSRLKTLKKQRQLNQRRTACKTRRLLLCGAWPYTSASRNKSSSILSVRTWAKCSDWFSRFLRAMNSGIFSNAPYLYAWMMYSEVWNGAAGKNVKKKTVFRDSRVRFGAGEVGTQAYIFLVGVEKPEGEVAGLGGSGELTQRLGVTR